MVPLVFTHSQLTEASYVCKRRLTVYLYTLWFFMLELQACFGAGIKAFTFRYKGIDSFLHYCDVGWFGAFLSVSCTLVSLALSRRAFLLVSPFNMSGHMGRLGLRIQITYLWCLLAFDQRQQFKVEAHSEHIRSWDFFGAHPDRSQVCPGTSWEGWKGHAEGGSTLLSGHLGQLVFDWNPAILSQPPRSAGRVLSNVGRSFDRQPTHQVLELVWLSAVPPLSRHISTVAPGSFKQPCVRWIIDRLDGTPDRNATEDLDGSLAKNGPMFNWERIGQGSELFTQVAPAKPSCLVAPVFPPVCLWLSY